MLLGLRVGGVHFSRSCNLSGGSGGGLAFGVHCGVAGPSQPARVLLLFVLAFL